MKAVSKYIYKREKNIKSTIITWENDKGEASFTLDTYWLYPKESNPPQPTAIKLKEFKGKILWVVECYLGGISVDALSFARQNKEEYRGKIVKLNYERK